MDMQEFSALAAGVGALTGIGSLIVSLVSLSRAKKAAALAKTANDISASALSNAQNSFRNVQGDSELAIHKSITDALNRLEDSSLEHEKAKSTNDVSLISSTLILLEAAIQNLLNAYDVHCQRYLDDKLDRTRFVRTYQRRIQELFDDEKPYKKFIKDSSSTKYHALHDVHDVHDVHDELNNPEFRR